MLSDWEEISIGKVLTLQAQEPEFNPQNIHLKARWDGMLIIPDQGDRDPWAWCPASRVHLVSSRPVRASL